MNRFIFASTISFLLVGGCSVERPAPARLPPPSGFHISGTANINLTPQIAAQTGLPSTLKAKLDAKARSEAISVSPLRSRHEGHLSLIVTDGSGQQSLANVNIDISGESEGSPTEGLGQALNRFLDAASLISSPVPQLGSRAQSMPASR